MWFLFVDKKYQDIQTVDGVKVLPVEKLTHVNKAKFSVIVCIFSEIALNYKDEIYHTLLILCPESNTSRCGKLLSYLLILAKLKKFVSKDKIISNCGALSLLFEFMPYLELLDGEALLNSQIKDIIAELLEIPNIGYIKIFTNELMGSCLKTSSVQLMSLKSIRSIPFQARLKAGFLLAF